MAQDGLTQDYDAHVPFTFVQVPDAPPLAHATARVKRWFVIAFAESWLAVLLFRMKRRFRRTGVPLLPGICDLLSRALFRVQIGNDVEIGAGLMITHGNAVIDGRTRIGRNCQINPWVTIGLSNSRKLGFSAEGPTIGDNVHIGTGAKVLGPVTVGDYARIGANAVVVHDVPANVTVVGAPARVAGSTTAPSFGDGSGRDERLAAHMRQAIIDYRLRRQSLRSLVDALSGSFDIGSERLNAERGALDHQMRFLEASASSGADGAPQVLDALEAIDRALAAYAESGRG